MIVIFIYHCFRNRISYIQESDFIHVRETLTTLRLGENRLIDLPSNIFTNFSKLNWLSLEGNYLSDIALKELPELENLDLSHNLLKKFTMSDLSPSIKWLCLRNNYINQIEIVNSNKKFKLNKLDFGKNLIEVLPSGLFNKSITVKELLLDRNRIRYLPAAICKGTQMKKLILSHNKLTKIHMNAFHGCRQTLTILDLNNNQLRTLPAALKFLRKLKWLYVALQ